MINIWEVNETNKMVEQENLDVRTITIGISLLECIDSDLKKLNENIYNRITTVAKDLAAVGEKIENEYGIPIVNKRISVTPIALVGGAACKTPEDFATIADTLDRAAAECSKLGKTQIVKDAGRGMVRNTGFCDQNTSCSCIRSLSRSFVLHTTVRDHVSPTTAVRRLPLLRAADTAAALPLLLRAP